MRALTLRELKHANNSSKSLETLTSSRCLLAPHLLERLDPGVRMQRRPEFDVRVLLFLERTALAYPNRHLVPSVARAPGPHEPLAAPLRPPRRAAGVLGFSPAFQDKPTPA